MEIDAQINYPLEELREAEPEFARMSDDELKAAAAASLVSQVMQLAEEELRRHGQKPKPRISAAGQNWETGVEMMTIA